MKRLVLLWSLIFAMVLLGGCNAAPSSQKEIHIVTTSFPAFDLVRTLTADCEDISVSMLLKPGTESHTYDASAADIIALHDASLFVYIGSSGEAWAETMIASSGKSLETFVLTDHMPLIADEHGIDPHVWTSPLNMKLLASSLSARICALSGLTDQSKAKITENTMTYSEALNALDQKFRDLFDQVAESDKLLVFGDRFPFRYFAKEYGLSHIAAFHGCAEESEPAASTVASLIDTVRKRRISTVFYVELSAHRIADTIASETGAQTALLHSCHNVTQEEFDQGVTYLLLMEQNYNTLSIAFFA